MKVPVKIYTEISHEHGLPEYAHQGDLRSYRFSFDEMRKLLRKKK